MTSGIEFIRDYLVILQATDTQVSEIYDNVFVWYKL